LRRQIEKIEQDGTFSLRGRTKAVRWESLAVVVSDALAERLK
jgi:hypothetical protein